MKKDEQWLDENVTTYEPGSIPVDLSPAQAQRECVDCWDDFKKEFGVKSKYRSKLVFEWLGY